MARRRLRLGGGAALRIGRSSGDHGQAPFAGRGGQRSDQRRFRQVLPVALGHLLLHRAELQARRVEDAPVVGEPELLAGVGRRRLVAARARAEPEPLAVPAHAALRRQDRPAHGREAAREEGRRRLDDVMLGLEPGDVQRRAALVVAIGDRPEADEGLHLVHVAPHRLRHLVGAQPVGIERIGAQTGLDLEAPEQPIEQAEAIGVAVQDDALAERQERRRRADRRHRSGAAADGGGHRGDMRIGVEEIELGVVGAVPADAIGRDLRGPQLAAGAPEAGEIGRAGERHRAQRGLWRSGRRRRHQRGSAAIRHHGGELSAPEAGRVAGVVEQRGLPRRRRVAQAARRSAGRVVERLAGTVIGELDEGQHLGERHAQPLEVGAAQPAHAARLQQARDRLDAEARARAAASPSARG